MHQRHPHRFFVGLFSVALVAIHLAPGSQAAANPKSTATPVSSDTSVVPPANSSTNTNTTMDPPASSSTSSSTDVTPQTSNTSTNTSTDGPVSSSSSTNTTTNIGKPGKLKATGDIALCDLGDPDTKKHAGFGAPVMSWPVKADSSFNSTASNYINGWQAKTVGNEAFERVHIAFTDSAQPNAPSLKVAHTDRVAFAGHAFGAVLGGVNNLGAIERVCLAKRAADESSAALTRLQQFSDSAENVDSCVGAYEKTREMLDRVIPVVTKYDEEANNALKGSTQYTDPSGKKRSSNLESLFKDGRREDYLTYELVTTKEPKLSAADAKALYAEIQIAWGKASSKSMQDTEKLDPSGVFARVLLQTRTERDHADAQLKALKDYDAQLLNRKARCDSLAGAAPKVGPKTTDGSTVTGPVKGPEVAGPLSSAQTTNDKTSNDTRNPISTATVPPPNDPTQTYNPRGDRTPLPNETDQSLGKGNNSQGGGAGAFLKDNWMWLAGGAALVGGGYYLYTQHQKSEERQAYWQNDANFAGPPPLAPLNSNTSGGGTTSGGGFVPAGARLIITSSVSSPSVGQIMSAITLSLVDASGMLQTSVNGVQVEASCLTPNPCSLDGAKSVTLNGGNVSFTGLKFDQPDQNVTLQFSAPGVASVTTQAPFSVTGSAPRQ